MNLCTNCLEVGKTRGVNVGPVKGPQRDPYQDRVHLCEVCADALIGGDFATLHARYSAERRVSR